MAAATERSNRSSVLRALSSSPKLHHHQRSASRYKLDLHLRFFPPAAANKNRTCVCSPSTHPRSFRCNFHRRLENEKIGSLDGLPRRQARLHLIKKALMNSLNKIGSVEAMRFRKSLEATLVKRPSFSDFNRRREFRPRLSRFYAMHINQV